VQGLDATVEHLGKAGHVGDVEVRDAGLAQRRGGAARGHQFDAVERPGRVAKFDQSGLVPDAQQRSHLFLQRSWPPTRALRPSRIAAITLPTTSGYKLALDGFDAFVQRLFGVRRVDRDATLGQDWSVVELLGGHVHRAARLGHPLASAWATACQPLNAGNRLGCVFKHSTG
jgi:hypothetical protein